MSARTLPYDAVIFDLDGTLTDSEPGIVNCVQYALAKFGIRDLDPEQLRAYIGPPLNPAFQQLSGLSPEDAERAVLYYRERYNVDGFLENRVFEGIPALLKTLKARGAYLALATAKPHPVVDMVLDAFDLTKYFDRIMAPGGEHGLHDKASLVRAALPTLCHRACMVGDRLFDIEGARSCGIDAVGAGYGYGGREELERAGATTVVDSVAELTRLLLAGGPTLPGVFISIEGPDGCGKSTQHALLAQWLVDCGHALTVTREPGGCAISERIRAVVLDAREHGMSDMCEALLFAAARAQHVREVIRPSLERGAHVLCDRFVDSSIAYQGIGRNLGAELVRSINAPAVDGVMPSLTLLLDIDPDCALRRRVAADSPDRIEVAGSDFARRVHEGYLELAARERKRFQIIDANGAPEAVLARLKRAVSKVV